MKQFFIFQAVLFFLIIFSGCDDQKSTENGGDASILLPADLIYVADEEGVVHVFDLATYERLGEIAVGDEPSEIYATPDGSLLWVVNTGSHSVSLIETATHTIKTIDVGTSPVHSFITPDHSEIWVGNDDSANISIIDIGLKTVSHTLLTGEGHHKMAFATDSTGSFTFGYVSNIVDGSITPISADYTVLSNVEETGSSPHGMDFDETTGYVLNCSGGLHMDEEETFKHGGTEEVSFAGIELIATIDDETTVENEQHTIVDRIVLEEGRCSYLHVEEDGFAYFTIPSANLLGRMNLLTHEVETFDAGSNPDKFAIVNDIAFVSNTTTPIITAITLSTGASQSINTGNPIDPDDESATASHRSILAYGGNVYVPNEFDGTVSVINATSLSLVATLQGMEHPVSIAIAGPLGGTTYPR